MSFGLINAPATFQTLMNHIFEVYLRVLILGLTKDLILCLWA